MSVRERQRTDTYTTQLPETILTQIEAMGTKINFDGVVSVVRRRVREHSDQPLSAFFASDAFFLNVFQTLLAPTRWKPQELERHKNGALKRDSYVFFLQGFCQEHHLIPEQYKCHPMVKMDLLRVVLDFASKNFNTDAQTVTYYLVDPNRPDQL